MISVDPGFAMEPGGRTREVRRVPRNASSDRGKLNSGGSPIGQPREEAGESYITIRTVSFSNLVTASGGARVHHMVDNHVGVTCFTDLEGQDMRQY